LCDVQGFRRTGKAAQSGDFVEVAQLFEVHVSLIGKQTLSKPFLVYILSIVAVQLC
jgi:hypothetical protein